MAAPGALVVGELRAGLLWPGARAQSKQIDRSVDNFITMQHPGLSICEQFGASQLLYRSGI